MKRLVAKLLRAAGRFAADQEGPTAVTYAMLLLLIVLACLTAVTLFGQATAGSFDQSANSITDAFESVP